MLLIFLLDKRVKYNINDCWRTGLKKNPVFCFTCTVKCLYGDSLNLET